MGVVNHNCDSTYNNVYVQTYALILLNVAVFITLKYFLEEYVLPWVVSSYIGVPYTALATNDDDLSGMESLVRTDNSSRNKPFNLNNFGKSNSLLGGVRTASANARIKYTGKLLFVVFQFLVAIFTFLAGVYYSDKSATLWNQYQDFYGFIVNTGVLTSFISCAIFRVELNKKMLAEKSPEFDKIARYAALMTGVVALILVPPILTHLIPASVVFGWVIIAFIIGIFLIFVVLICLLEAVTGLLRLLCQFESPPASDKLFQMGLELAWRLLAIVWFQTFYSYMYTFYQVHSATMTGTDYIGVIQHDYELRTQSACSFHHAVDSLQHALVFFNWL